MPCVGDLVKVVPFEGAGEKRNGLGYDDWPDPRQWYEVLIKEPHGNFGPYTIDTGERLVILREFDIAAVKPRIAR